ncbi:MAG: hypothetical protein D6796_07305 [Caldilineae bacterium]|nr:MAG: hypothetical protein D6796_07305 [Caldilineae bacterium]
MLYLVTVKNQGIVVQERVVDAPDALTAINQVEREFGEPVTVEYVLVELEDGRKQPKMVVHNWHGYSFLARRLTPEEATARR